MPPILFVHGFWHGAWCWEEHFVPWFASKGYEVRAVNLRGHDQKHAKGLRTVRISDYVADVAAAAAQMSSPPVVVAHSMGGFVTQKYLEEHRAPAAVMVASVPPAGVWGPTVRFAARHPLVLLGVNLTWSLYGVIGTRERAREMLFGRDLPQSLVDGYFERLTDDSYRVYVSMLGLVRPDVPKVRRTPMLVVGGEVDRTISQGEVAATARTYGAELAMFPGAHDLMLEPCWDQVASRIDAFVRSLQAA